MFFPRGAEWPSVKALLRNTVLGFAPLPRPWRNPRALTRAGTYDQGFTV